MYLSFDQDCKDLGKGHYLTRTQINAGGSKCGHYSNYHIKGKHGARFSGEQKYFHLTNDWNFFGGVIMSQSIPTGYTPRQPPGISSKTLPGGSGFDF